MTHGASAGRWASQRFTAALWTLSLSCTTTIGPRTCVSSTRRNSVAWGVLMFPVWMRKTTESRWRSREGGTTMPPITLSRSRRSQQRRIGVWPRGAHERRTRGWSMKPDSSRKTVVAFSRRAFF